MLAKMFGEDWNSAKDSNGSYLIDRTPEYFAPILNYLRCGVLVIDDGVNAEGVLHEAKFFNIGGIADKLSTIVERKSHVDAFSRKDVISILLTSSTNSTLRCQGLNLAGMPPILTIRCHHSLIAPSHHSLPPPLTLTPLHYAAKYQRCMQALSTFPPLLSFLFYISSNPSSQEWTCLAWTSPTSTSR